jgi:hypothetical protein
MLFSSFYDLLKNKYFLHHIKNQKEP